MEPPPPPPLEPPRPPDASSLLVGVALGLFGVPLLVGAALYALGLLYGLVSGGGGYSPGAAPAYLVGLAVLGLVVMGPVWLYRRGYRRMAQGVLIGYGLLALVFGGCVVLVLSSLGNMH